ncbi:MAG TPA: hypothetical protein VNI54_01640 [Thermoanaerobaculia bacterium]|nr:hypothetical protein [Thermoanaerobaculia bacterium]
MHQTVTRALVLLVCALALQSCGCTTSANRLVIGCRPDIGTTLDQNDLEPVENRKIGAIAAALGFLTTPFKRLGILGWRDLDAEVVVTGEVIHSVHSTDRFLTVDVRITELLADGQPVPLTSTRYLRAEVCERDLALPKAKWPCPGDRVRIAGRLKWDGDGFLEVHPQRAQQVEVLQSSAPCTF